VFFFAFPLTSVNSRSPFRQPPFDHRWKRLCTVSMFLPHPPSRIPAFWTSWDLSHETLVSGSTPSFFLPHNLFSFSSILLLFAMCSATVSILLPRMRHYSEPNIQDHPFSPRSAEIPLTSVAGTAHRALGVRFTAFAPRLVCLMFRLLSPYCRGFLDLSPVACLSFPFSLDPLALFAGDYLAGCGFFGITVRPM